MKILLLILTVLIFFISTNVFGQAKKIRWQTEICEFEGTYDSKKYSETSVKNTAELISMAGLPLVTDATVRKFEEIAALSVEALDREYKQKHDRLKNLEIVDLPYFQTLKQKKLRELEQVYLLSRVTMLAYEKPSVIGEYKAAEACVMKYGAPLAAGGEELLGIWRVVNEDARRKNADPQRLERIFNEQMRSADREKFARVEVMAFGWWNCANEFIEYVEEDSARQENFKKLFTKVRKIYCDEP